MGSALTLKFALPILFAGCLLSGFGGWKLRDADYQRHLRADAEVAVTVANQARAIDRASLRITSDQAAITATLQARSRETTRTILQEVTRYVPQQATLAQQAQVPLAQVEAGGALDPRLGGLLPPGFIRLHDAAAANDPAILSSPASADSIAGPGVDLPALARTLAINYGICAELRGEVEGWREWYAQQSAAWPRGREVGEPVSGTGDE